MDPKSITYSALKLLEHQIQVSSAAMDWDQSIHLLDKVLEINPRSANALLQIGKIHGMRYDYDEAINWFERAVEVSPRKQHAMVLTEAGRMAKDFYDTSISESLYEEALEIARNTKGRDAMADLLDAKIALASTGLASEKANLGFVPIINFRLLWNMDSKFGILLEGDALAAPQGRAEDVQIAATYKLSDNLRVRAGYRILEGGADNDSVYNFALFHYASIGLSYTF